MRRFLFLSIIFCALGIIGAKAADFGPMTYDYEVRWKYGLINLTAAQAQVTAQCSGTDFSGTFGGHSIEWEGRIYSVQDTLHATLTPTAASIRYIDGCYRKPHAGRAVDPDNPESYVTLRGEGTLSASPSTMEAVHITANMLSLFYYAKVLDFDSMSPGQTTCIDISDGLNGVESLSITYKGKGQSHADSCPGETYDIEFNFSYGGSPSAYPVTCQISCDSRVPIYFSANIKIGHVAMSMK